MRKVIALVALVLVLSAPTLAAVTRIDTNGALWFDNYTPGVYINQPINGWAYYNSDGAAITNMGGVYVNTKDSNNTNANALIWENEGDDWPGTSPSGHSVIFGGKAGGPVGYQYGIKQSYSTTAGKLYWFFGAQRWNTSGAGYQADFGIEDGAGYSSGKIASFNAGDSTMGRNGAQFSMARIATGNTMTAHAGIKLTSSPTGDLNGWVDGLRAIEIDIPVYSALTNGGFEGTSTNISQWKTREPSAGYDKKVFDIEVLDGWLPIGTYNNKLAKVQKLADPTGRGGSILNLDQYYGEGRMTWFQRISPGAGTYDISGFIRTWDLTYADGRIGVDFSGGLDPDAAGVVWSDKSTAIQPAWQQRVIRGDTGANGLTIFISTGNTSTSTGKTGLSQFDDITLTEYVPEPGSLLALGTGLIGLLGVIRRRK